MLKYFVLVLFRVIFLTFSYIYGKILMYWSVKRLLQIITAVEFHQKGLTMGRCIVEGTNQPVLRLSEFPVGTKFLTELDSVLCEAGPFKSKVISIDQVNGKPDPINFAEELALGFDQKRATAMLGENPYFMRYQTQGEGCELNVRLHYNGHFKQIDLVRSGPIVAARGAFVAAIEGIRMDSISMSPIIAKKGKLGSFMQKFSPGPNNQVCGGKILAQYLWLEAHGDIIEHRLDSTGLHGHKSLRIRPGHIVAFSEGIELSLDFIEPEYIRPLIGVDFYIVLKGDGIVFEQTGSMDDRFRKP